MCFSDQATGDDGTVPEQPKIPDTIVLKRDRDLAGRRHEIWVRRGLFALLCVVPVLALLNAFGQRPATAAGDSAAASLRVEAPERVRAGLLFQARLRVTAHRDLRKATLVLAPGWAESMTINTVEPAPIGEASDDGRLSFELGHIAAGTSYVLYLQFQVNPTNVGRRAQTVELDDGDRRLLVVHRTITVFP
jgi:hypothetical protein